MSSAHVQQARSSLTIREVRLALWRHKFKAGGFFLASVLIAVGVILWMPRTYSSSVKLFVRPGRESLTLDPSATTGENLHLATSEEIAINSVLEILNSRTVAQKVVDRFGTEAILEGVASQSNGPAPPAADGFTSTVAAWITSAKCSVQKLRERVSALDPVDDHETAVTRIGKMVQSQATPFSNVVNIECKAGSPREAQTIVGAFTDVFMTEYLNVHRTEGSLQFFADQTKMFEEQISTAEEELRKEKDRYGLVSLEGQREMLEGQLGRVKSRLLEVDGLSAASAAKIQTLTASLTTVPERINSQSVKGFGHQATDGMRQQLYDLEIQELEFLSKYTEDSPFVKAIRRQRANVEAILKEQPTDRTQSTDAINPVHQALKQDQLLLEATASSMHGEKQELQNQEKQLGKRQQEFNEHEMKVDRLERRVELLKSQYEAHASNLEQARIDRALAADRISSINILQPATYQARPLAPNKQMVLAIGILFGGVGGVALALLAEYFDSSVKSEADIEHHLAVPVFVSLPRSAALGQVMR